MLCHTGDTRERMSSIVAFEDLAEADLTVEAVYLGGSAGTVADDPLGKLLPGVGNQGGFRYAGSRLKRELRAVVLYSSGTDTDWPDALDRETGLFTYFGDNRVPGKELHATPRGGNDILRWCFSRLHTGSHHRSTIPPFFIFSKANPGAGRSVRFLGLAVPGAPDVQPSDDLVAIWRTAKDQRFQNYRATFTILDAASISRAWINELAAGITLGTACPEPYRHWVEHGVYTPLASPRVIQFRTKEQQTPDSPSGVALVRVIYDYFADDPHAFEACAIELWKMQAKEAITFVATRRSADGGRDAYGWYSLGPGTDPIRLEWSLEAKLYAPGNGAGVKETSRLISRMRHREFGVFVTTSYIGRQAYEELRGDQHPVVVICGRDVADLLKAHGYGTPSTVRSWLEGAFPKMPVGAPKALLRHPLVDPARHHAPR